MSKVGLDILIKNETHQEDYQTEGILKDATLSFFDPKQQKHVLKLSQNRIDYERKGIPGFIFVFEKHQSHTGKYYVSHDNYLVFDIQTHRFYYNEDKINIAYTLKQAEDIVGHSEIDIRMKY